MAVSAGVEPADLSPGTESLCAVLVLRLAIAIASASWCGFGRLHVALTELLAWRYERSVASTRRIAPNMVKSMATGS